MMKDEDISNYMTSVEMVLKDLRSKKGVSQASANMEFEEKYGFSINFGRIETNPNFKMITFLYICDYYGISVAEFSKRVLNKTKPEITKFLSEKESRRKKRSSKR